MLGLLLRCVNARACLQAAGKYRTGHVCVCVILHGDSLFFFFDVSETFTHFTRYQRNREKLIKQESSEDIILDYENEHLIK